jgi:hypothetical protein
MLQQTTSTNTSTFKTRQIPEASRAVGRGAGSTQEREERGQRQEREGGGGAEGRAEGAQGSERREQRARERRVGCRRSWQPCRRTSGPLRSCTLYASTSLSI